MSAYPIEYDAYGNPTKMKMYASKEDLQHLAPYFEGRGVSQNTQAEGSGSSGHKSSSKDKKHKSSSSKDKKK